MWWKQIQGTARDDGIEGTDEGGIKKVSLRWRIRGYIAAAASKSQLVS